MRHYSTALFVCFLLLRNADSHGFMSKPASRNAIAWQNGSPAPVAYCPHCLSSGGVLTMKRKISSFPIESPETPATAYRHGLCGDPSSTTSSDIPQQATEIFLHKSRGAIQGQYRAGEGIEIELEITANHAGYFEFYLCDTPSEMIASPARGQACLNKHRLVRAANGPDDTPIDGSYPSRWYTPSLAFGDGADSAPIDPAQFGTQASSGQTVSKGRIMPNSQLFKLKFLLPFDVECERCVLQWYWRTANSCNPAGLQSFLQAIGKSDWARNSNMSPCGGDHYAEEFWNCADIKVSKDRSSTPSIPTSSPATPAPAPMSTPTPAMPIPVASEPQPEPEPRPEPEPQLGCSKLWGQCGGVGWSGATCCVNSQCKCSNTWYSQCQPSNDSAPPSLPPPPSPANGECAADWGKCGGQGWTGPTCCSSGWQCEVGNPWYSQCKPAAARRGRQLRGST